MRKIILFITLIMSLLFLIGCENPFAEVEDKINAIQNAIDIASEVEDIEAIMDSVVNAGSLDAANLDEIQSSLNQINSLLDNDATTEILQSYADAQGVDLDAAIADIDTYLDDLPDPSDPQQAAILSTVNSIISKIQ